MTELVNIVGKNIVITIPIDALSGKYGLPPAFMDDDFNNTIEITDVNLFAKYFLMAIEKEKEDGSTTLSDFLDKCFELAVNDGAEGIEFLPNWNKK